MGLPSGKLGSLLRPDALTSRGHVDVFPWTAKAEEQKEHCEPHVLLGKSMPIHQDAASDWEKVGKDCQATWTREDGSSNRKISTERKRTLERP